jgi:hypothetical protein
MKEIHRGPPKKSRAMLLGSWKTARVSRQQQGGQGESGVLQEGDERSRGARQQQSQVQAVSRGATKLTGIADEEEAGAEAVDGR